MANRRLSPQQLAFIDEYLRTSNATQSYIFAYYTAQGKKPPKHKVATSRASQLLATSSVSGHLESKRKELSKQNGVIDPSELMQIWSTISRLDPVEMYSEDGELLAVKDMPKHIRQAISKITVNEFISEKSDGTEVSRRTRTDIQLIDKHPALNNIADVYGIRKNGTSELMREFLNANGVSITINQTINNDNRQVTYNQPALERVLEVVQDG